VTVREARPEEHEALLALRRAVFAEEQGFRAAAKPDTDDPLATHLVAVEDGVVVGTCRLVPSRDGRLRLGYLAVARAARGRGIGTAILDEAVARALVGGFSTVVLHAEPAAVGLYARAGFRTIGPRDVLGTTLVTMELRVS
jgi:predicted GNAT family N-acyltransferase